MLAIAEILQRDQVQLVAMLGLPTSEARFEAQLLMATALRVNRAWLLAHGDEMPPDDGYNHYRNWLARRLQGEPVAYIFGEKEFYGISLTVTPDVLIPRPETELLVELALDRIPVATPCRVLDLGTGSGAIAISLASLRPQADIIAVDNSSAALQVAQANAQRLALPNLRFILSDWWQQVPVTPLFNLIISNPPYIANADTHLQQGDLRFEPISALAAGDTGLDDLSTIIRQAGKYLTAKGVLLLEHGYEQGATVRNLLLQNGFEAVQSYHDLGVLERVTVGQRS